MFRVKLHREAKKSLNKLHPNDRQRVINKLLELQRNPFSRILDVKKLVESKSSYRLRIGSIRVIFEVDKKTKIIFVWEIGYRGRIY